MKHVLLTALALMLVGAAVPTASAQIPTQAPATLEIRIAPPEGPVDADGVNLPVRVEYCYFFLGSLAMTATEVVLKIADAPEWGEASVTPSTLHFDIESSPHGSTVCSAPQHATVQILPFGNATDAEPAKLRVTATAQPNAPIAGAATEDAVLVRASHADCHHPGEDATAPATGTDASRDEGDGTLTAQTAGATPFVSPVNAAVLALGLAGAGAGAFTAVRRRRG